MLSQITLTILRPSCIGSSKISITEIWFIEYKLTPTLFCTLTFEPTWRRRLAVGSQVERGVRPQLAGLAIFLRLGAAAGVALALDSVVVDAAAAGALGSVGFAGL